MRGLPYDSKAKPMRPGAKHNFRLLLYLVQQGCCVWCGQIMSFGRKKGGAPARDFATFEHIDRREQGGKMSASNIVLACYKCNIRRNAEWQKKKAPRVAPSRRSPPQRGNGHLCRGPQISTDRPGDHAGISSRAHAPYFTRPVAGPCLSGATGVRSVLCQPTQYSKSPTFAQDATKIVDLD